MKLGSCINQEQQIEYLKKTKVKSQKAMISLLHHWY